MVSMKEQPQYIQAMVLLLFFWTITAGLILTSFRCDKHKKQQLQHLAAFLFNLSMIAVFSVAINVEPLFEEIIANRSNWRVAAEISISLSATVTVALVLAVVTYFTNTLAYYNYSRALIAREKGSDLEVSERSERALRNTRVRATTKLTHSFRFALSSLGAGIQDFQFQQLYLRAVCEPLRIIRGDNAQTASFNLVG